MTSLPEVMAYCLTRKAAEDLGEIYMDGVQKFGSRQADHDLVIVKPATVVRWL